MKTQGSNSVLSVASCKNSARLFDGYTELSDACAGAGESVLLTDCPVVVELKKEFRALDEQEESLKAEWILATPGSDGRERIRLQRERVEQRKKEISKDIFLHGLEQKETKPETVLRELR